MLISIDGNRSPAVCPEITAGALGKDHCWPFLLSKAGAYLGKKRGNTVQWKTFGGSRRHINCQNKKLVRRETLVAKKEGRPGGSFEKRGTGRETGEYELNCSYIQQGEGDSVRMRTRHQISILMACIYCLSQQ